MGKTDPEAIARAHRRARAVGLRTEGLTIREIAEALDVSVGTAWADLDTALRDVPAEDVDTLRLVELERLDALQRAVWEAALSGDLQAVDRALKVIALRCRLMGLNAPERIDVGNTDLDLDKAVRDLVDAIQTPPAPRYGDEDFLDYTPDGRPLRDDDGNLIDYTDGEV
ncbi:hypothetical protein NYP18_03565 [Corynebacterium sp. YIM 101645]|uniref:Uncharacterized protein n=1 Tax=Corynebacterium lemuris TaxID=1859292 RepID=A0ABT2FU29_9CORY|nr:helix-turn-helix domain-containing protein [Corynebacterium lemuris]MCS5478727.1 hypothetical protein [Corynebacterium lemuris]